LTWRWRFDDAERGANAMLSTDLPKQEIRGPDEKPTVASRSRLAPYFMISVK
jgi:hypothetical protein